MKSILEIIAQNPTEKTRIKKNTRHRLLQIWQCRWDRKDKDIWTHELVPDVGKSIIWTHGEVIFYLTQTFSGYGIFGKYLQRFLLRLDGICELCNVDEDDVQI